jgi:hypothetical protein
MKRTIPALALLITACASTQTPPEPVVETVEVRVPVAVTCVPDGLSGPPEYADTVDALLAAEDAAMRLALILAGRDQRIARLAALEPVIEACR